MFLIIMFLVYFDYKTTTRSLLSTYRGVVDIV
jgi:hypothetical protein